MESQTPLEMIAPCACVLTLPVLPKRMEKVREHLTVDCSYPEKYLHFFSGKVRDGFATNSSTNNNVENNEISIMDCLFIKQNLMDDVSDNIFENHIAMIRDAYDRFPDAPWILFLEDDARFDRTIFNKEIANHVVSFMKSGNAEVLLLGVLPFQKGFGLPIATYYQPSIVRHWSMTICAHAYLLTRRAMSEILQFADSRKGVHHPRMHFDMIFHFLKMKVHSVYPMICFQNKDPAMYQRIQTMIPLLQCISFRRLSQCMVHLSLLVPVFLAILFSVCLFFLSRRTYRLFLRLRQPSKNNHPIPTIASL
jgi:hypothetical protein